MMAGLSLHPLPLSVLDLATTFPLHVLWQGVCIWTTLLGCRSWRRSTRGEIRWLGSPLTPFPPMSTCPDNSEIRFQHAVEITWIIEGERRSRPKPLPFRPTQPHGVWDGRVGGKSAHNRSVRNRMPPGHPWPGIAPYLHRLLCSLQSASYLSGNATPIRHLTYPRTNQHHDSPHRDRARQPFGDRSVMYLESGEFA